MEKFVTSSTHQGHTRNGLAIISFDILKGKLSMVGFSFSIHQNVDLRLENEYSHFHIALVVTS